MNNYVRFLLEILFINTASFAYYDTMRPTRILSISCTAQHIRHIFIQIPQRDGIDH
jgi:hypothetical protein